MLKVIDIFPIGNRLSVTLDGVSDKLGNGSQLIDSRGNTVRVISVGMVRYNDPDEINKTTTVLIEKCNIDVGEELSIA